MGMVKQILDLILCKLLVVPGIGYNVRTCVDGITSSEWSEPNGRTIDTPNLVVVSLFTLALTLAWKSGNG
jgi:hypothetical protein